MLNQDLFGNTIKLGDYVLFGFRGDPLLGRVIKMTLKSNNTIYITCVAVYKSYRGWKTYITSLKRLDKVIIVGESFAYSYHREAFEKIGQEFESQE